LRFCARRYLRGSIGPWSSPSDGRPNLETNVASRTNTTSRPSVSAKLISACKPNGLMPNVGAIDSRSGHNRTRVPPRGRRLLGAEAPASAAELSFPDSALRSGVTRVHCYPTAHGILLRAGLDSFIPGLRQVWTASVHRETATKVSAAARPVILTGWPSTVPRTSTVPRICKNATGAVAGVRAAARGAADARTSWTRRSIRTSSAPRRASMVAVDGTGTWPRPSIGPGCHPAYRTACTENAPRKPPPAWPSSLDGSQTKRTADRPAADRVGDTWRPP